MFFYTRMLYMNLQKMKLLRKTNNLTAKMANVYYMPNMPTSKINVYTHA